MLVEIKYKHRLKFIDFNNAMSKFLFLQGVDGRAGPSGESGKEGKQGDQGNTGNPGDQGETVRTSKWLHPVSSKHPFL